MDATNPTNEYVFDDYRREVDEGFVMNSWIKSYGNRSPEARTMHPHAFAKMQHARATALLQRATVIMMRPDDWPEGIVGWVCGEHHNFANVFHYGFVKSGYRRKGYAARLYNELAARVFEPGSKVFTHRRLPWSVALERRGHSWNPHYL